MCCGNPDGSLLLLYFPENKNSRQHKEKTILNKQDTKPEKKGDRERETAMDTELAIQMKENNRNFNAGRDVWELLISPGNLFLRYTGIC